MCAKHSDGATHLEEGDKYGGPSYGKSGQQGEHLYIGESDGLGTVRGVERSGIGKGDSDVDEEAEEAGKPSADSHS